MGSTDIVREEGGGTLRLYRELNQVTIKNRYPLPRLDDLSGEARRTLSDEVVKFLGHVVSKDGIEVKAILDWKQPLEVDAANVLFSRDCKGSFNAFANTEEYRRACLLMSNEELMPYDYKGWTHCFLLLEIDLISRSMRVQQRCIRNACGMLVRMTIW
ncbi:uncharacterized protein LOC131317110 [Rhododendron vialii]|uniref:uncharacterized protein LOC131317110 n=1 Tax=Rhododendron vialii TaxID=182163 RepID=UPI00265FCF27|nr:uncharacterized protein LOC131317110 [Rhododendron vialii]